MTDTLTPDEVEAITGKKNAAQQAAALARRRIAFKFNGAQIKVERGVALAFELMPQRTNYGPDWSQVN